MSHPQTSYEGYSGGYWLTECSKIKGQSEWISIGGLGVTGLTAWAGAFDVIPNLNKDQVVVVSGAAG